MATSGTAYTNSYNTAEFYCSWSRTNYSSSGNYSDISWSAGLHIGGNYEWYSNAIRINSVVINGTTVMGSTTVSNKSGPGWFEMGSGNTRIYHNDDGTKSFTISISGWLYSNHDLSGSNDFTLNTIPRYVTGATITSTSKTATSVTLSLSANENCSAFEYKIGNGSWVNIPIASNRKSTTVTVTGLTPGTNYTFYGDFKRADSGLWAQTKPSVQVTTTNVGKITSAPDFNDEENPTIQYTNEYRNNVTSLQACISYDGTANIQYRDIPKTGTSYTFNLTNEERNILRNAIQNKNSMQVTFYIKSTIGQTNYYSTMKKTFRIINANPTFSNYVYEDLGVETNVSNETTVDLTGNSTYIIKGYNDVKITISNANKAIANKGAYMVKYSVSCGNLYDEANYSDNSDVVLSLSNIVDRTINVYATDSRNNSTLVSTIIPNWRDYSNLVFNSGNATRTNGASEETVLKFEGVMWATRDEYDFGAEANDIIVCEYQYKKTSENEEDYSSPISINPTITEISPSKFSYNLAIIGDEGGNGFNVSNSYDIRVTVKDKLSTSVYNILLGVGLPLIAIAPTGVSFGTGYDENEGGELQINGKDILNNLYQNEHYSLSTTITAGSWQKAQSTDYEIDLSKGKYLLIIGVAISASSNGVATLRPYINGSEERTSVRQTIPVLNLFTSTQIVTVINQNTDGTVYINAQVYPNVSCTIENMDIKIFQISKK